eukprot:SAG31_NODE_37946_length_300_cov_0.771144_1_plen_57_part_01
MPPVAVPSTGRRVLGLAQAELFSRDGFYVARSLFTAEEASLISAVCRADPRPRQGGG